MQSAQLCLKDSALAGGDNGLQRTQHPILATAMQDITNLAANNIGPVFTRRRKGCRVGIQNYVIFRHYQGRILNSGKDIFPLIQSLVQGMIRLKLNRDILTKEYQPHAALFFNLRSDGTMPVNNMFAALPGLQGCLKIQSLIMLQDR